MTFFIKNDTQIYINFFIPPEVLSEIKTSFERVQFHPVVTLKQFKNIIKVKYIHILSYILHLENQYVTSVNRNNGMTCYNFVLTFNIVFAIQV